MEVKSSSEFSPSSIHSLCPGIRASGDGELGAEGPDRGAPRGETTAHGNAEPPPAHLHREDRQRQDARQRGQPPARTAGFRE